MTTKEFIRAVRNLGYEAEKDEECITFKYKNTIIAYIFINELYRMSFYFPEIDCVENAGVLFALIFQYASTPVEDREEEKKYYLKHRYLQSSFTNLNDFLSYSASDNKLALSNGINFPKYKTHFTLKEIEEIKQKLNTDLADFELVEVKDEKV